MKRAWIWICAAAFAAESVCTAGPTTDKLRIPEIQFREARLPDVLTFLSDEVYRIHRVRVSFVLLNPAGQSRPITLQLRDVPLSEAVRYVATTAGLKCRFEPHAIVLFEPGTETQKMITQAYPIAPGALETVVIKPAESGGFRVGGGF